MKQRPNYRVWYPCGTLFCEHRHRCLHTSPAFALLAPSGGPQCLRRPVLDAGANRPFEGIARFLPHAHLKGVDGLFDDDAQQSSRCGQKGTFKIRFHRSTIGDTCYQFLRANERCRTPIRASLLFPLKYYAYYRIVLNHVVATKSAPGGSRLYKTF